MIPFSRLYLILSSHTFQLFIAQHSLVQFLLHLVEEIGTLNGNETVELGYILDNTYWHNGYGTEAARACLEYAFGELELKTVCCSIRPENVASIRVVERLGMTLCDNHTIIYNEKEMPHQIYVATNSKSYIL